MQHSTSHCPLWALDIAGWNMGVEDGGESIQHHLLGLLIKAHFTDTETEDQWLCPRCLPSLLWAYPAPLTTLVSSSQAPPQTLRASPTPKTMMMTEWMGWWLGRMPRLPHQTTAQGLQPLCHADCQIWARYAFTHICKHTPGLLGAKTKPQQALPTAPPQLTLLPTLQPCQSPHNAS